YFHLQDPPLVHGDLKPSNILVEPSGDGRFRLKIGDFGIGAGGASARRPHTSASLGSYSPLYSCLQRREGEPADQPDDVCALGVIWYQMLAGDLSLGPPHGSDWKKVLRQRGVPARHIACIDRCIGTRETRIKDCNTLARSLSIKDVIAVDFGATRSGYA